jgi:predicted SnoaL-like aldol condensation-catalyzing enzyme
MSTENKAIVHRFFEEIFNQQAYGLADEIVATDYINHNPAPNESPGREGLKQFAAYSHSGSETPAS